MKTPAIQPVHSQPILHVQPMANGIIPSIAHKALEWIRLIFSSFVSIAFSPYYLIANLTGFGKHASSLPRDNGNVNPAHSPLVQTLIDHRKMIFSVTAISLTFMTVAYGFYTYGITAPTITKELSYRAPPISNKYFNRTITKMTIPSPSSILWLGIGALTVASCFFNNRAEKDEIEDFIGPHELQPALQVGSQEAAPQTGSIVITPPRGGTKPRSFLSSVGSKFWETASRSGTATVSRIIGNSFRKLSSQGRTAVWDMFRNSLGPLLLPSSPIHSPRGSLEAPARGSEPTNSISISNSDVLLQKLAAMSPRGSLDTESPEDLYKRSPRKLTPDERAAASKALMEGFKHGDGNHLLVARAGLEDRLEREGIQVRQVDQRLRRKMKPTQCSSKIREMVARWGLDTCREKLGVDPETFLKFATLVESGTVKLHQNNNNTETFDYQLALGLMKHKISEREIKAMMQLMDRMGFDNGLLYADATQTSEEE